jgi:hypothetical protein
MGELLREVDDGQLIMLERDLRDDPLGIELLAMLAQSVALVRGEPLPDPDSLRPFVCFKYAVAARTSALLGTGSTLWNVTSHVPLERSPIRRAAYRRLWRGASEPIPRESSLHGHPAIRSRLARSLGVPQVVRRVRRTGLVLALIVVGVRIRRHVRGLDLDRERG